MSESDRIAELERYAVLDTGPEPAFDELVHAAAELTGCPTALVSLLDSDRQWFKARRGLDVGETPRDLAFCEHVLRAEAPVLVPDATLDPRFATNALVTGPPGIRFYAGHPLRTRSGAVLGTLCVLDYEARPQGLTAVQQRLLGVLAAQVMTQLELRRALAEADAIAAELRVAVNGFRAMAEDATDVVSRHLPDGTTVYVSPSLLSVLGYDPIDEVGRAAPERVHPDDAGAMADALRQVMTGAPATAVVRSRHADGTWRHLEIRLSPIRDDTGAVAELHAVARDVTERARAQELLRLSEERFRVLFDHNPIGQVELSPAGVVQRVNTAFADLVGAADPATLVGRPPAWATAPAERSAGAQDLGQAAARPGHVMHRERTIVRPDGTALEIAGTLVGVPGTDGSTEVLIGAVVDVTECNHAQRQLKELAAELAAARDEAVRRNALMGTVLETVGVGIVACDAEGRLTLFNRATREFHGMPPDPDADPGDWSDRYALYDQDGTTVLTREQIPLVRALVDGAVDDAIIVIAPHALPTRVVRCDGRAMHGLEGQLLGAVVVMTDITEARATARALSDQAEFKRVLLDTAQTAIWSCDTTERPTYVNATARNVLGWPDLVTLQALHDRGELPQMAGAVTMLRSDGEPFSLAERPLQRALGGQETGEIEVVLAARGRPRRTLLLQASPLRDSLGRVSGAMLTGHDVTDLRASEARFRAAFHDGPTAVARLDRDGVVKEVNPALRRMLGQRSAALVGHPLTGHVHADDQRCLSSLLSGAGTGAVPAELRLVRADGTPVWCDVATTVSTDGDGTDSVLAQFLDVDGRKTQELVLQQAARHDPLTSLANRSQLTSLIQTLLDAGAGVTAGLLFLDLDGFKSVNDSHGHEAGDAVLVEVASRLVAGVRPGDTVLRLGGDEFVVVCAMPPQATEVPLLALARRLEDAVAAPIAFRGTRVIVGGSIGAALARPGQPPHVLVEAADRAMYQRKQERRHARPAIPAPRL